MSAPYNPFAGPHHDGDFFTPCTSTCEACMVATEQPLTDAERITLRQVVEHRQARAGGGEYPFLAHTCPREVLGFEPVEALADMLAKGGV